MSLPEHLHPVTYWEKRCELMEDSVERLVQIFSVYLMPPAGQQALEDHMQTWNRLLNELTEEQPPAAGQKENEG